MVDREAERIFQSHQVALIFKPLIDEWESLPQDRFQVNSFAGMCSFNALFVHDAHVRKDGILKCIEDTRVVMDVNI